MKNGTHQKRPPIVDPHHALRAHWEKIYRDDYGLEADFTRVYIPPLPTDGKWRHLFILGGLTMNHAAAIYRKVVEAKYDGWDQDPSDLDACVTDNIRTSVESYVICVRDENQPDERYRGKPIDEVDPNKAIGVTLLERLVHGAIHLIEGMGHLDIGGITLCSGSRRPNGAIPQVYWHRDFRKVMVAVAGVGCWSGRGGGLREAVSG